MKVLMIGPARSVNGGISAVVNNYYKAGLDKKVQLRYIATMEDGSKLHKLKIAVQAFVQFVAIVSRYDLVHIHMASDVSLYRKLPFVCLSKIYNKKIVIQQHGGNVQEFLYSICGKKRQKFIKEILSKVDVFLVVAPYLKDVFKDIVGEEKIKILPNAIEIPQDVRHDYNEQNILFLGRICKEKGVHELLQVVKDLKCEFPKLQLYLGGVWVEEQLKEEAKLCGDFVHYLGWIESEKKEEYLRKCNIFVLPTYFEGLPMSLLEGMAYGCACVATEVGGIPQVMTDGKDGIMIAAKDTEALKKALKDLLQNPKLQEKLGICSIRTVEDKFEISRSVQQLVDIYFA